MLFPSHDQAIKTSLARALLPDAYLTRSIEGIRGCGSFRGGLILDDVDLTKLSPPTMLLLSERGGANIPARYHEITIPADTPMIVCTNDASPFCVFGHVGDAIFRRCVMVDVQNSLF